MLKIFLGFLITVTVVAGGFQISPRIFKGFRAAENQFPFYAFLKLVTSDERMFCCGATILSDSWLLTAGHCVANVNSVTVFLGSKHFKNQTKEESELIESNGIYIYPSFNRTTLKNDIALLKFKRPIKFNTYIQPVKLSDNCEFSVNESVFAIGFGETNEGSNLASNLRWAPLKVLPKYHCLNAYKILKRRHNYICAGSDSCRSIAFGDSGGPLVRKSDKSLIAVSSFIHKTGCNCGYPQVFSEFAKFSYWIATTTGLKIQHCS